MPSLVMDYQLERAARDGDISFLEEAFKRENKSGATFEYFLRKTKSRPYFNILNLATVNGRGEWINKALDILPRNVIQKLIYQYSDNGYNALHHSIQHKSTELIEALVNENRLLFSREVAVNMLNIKTSSGDTLVHLAALYDDIKTLKLLHEYSFEYYEGQKEKLWLEINEHGFTALHNAITANNLEIFMFLLDKYPSYAYLGLRKPLEYAASCGHRCLVEQLDEQFGEELWKKSSEDGETGNTPLHSALVNSRIEVVEFIMDRYPRLALVSNMSGDLPLDVASPYIFDQFSRIFLDKPELHSEPVQDSVISGNTVLHAAAISGHSDFIELMLKHKPQLVHHPNNKKETLLHLAIKHYETMSNQEFAIGCVPRIIEMLVMKESHVACWPDEEGFTPLHRAAYLCTTYNVEVIQFIIKHSSQSTKVLDNSGKTILHHMIDRITRYEQGKTLLSIPEINVLRDYVDNHGKSPLDMALEMNIIMVPVLLDFTAKQITKTTQGIIEASPFKHQNDFEVMKKQRMTMEEYGALSCTSSIKYKLQKYGMNFLLSQDSNKRTILHILLDLNKAITISSEDYVDLVHDILIKCPLLLYQIDVNGDTPLHVLVRNPQIFQFCFAYQRNGFRPLLSMEGSEFLLKLLELCCRYDVKARASAEGSHCHPPWLIQNIAGNTLLHEAFISNCHIDLVKKLYELDIEVVAKLINQKRETPLHILAEIPFSKYAEPTNNNINVVMDTLVSWSYDVIMMRDQDGSIPYERAIRAGNILGAFRIFNILDDKCVASVINVDNSTLLHMIINQQVHHSLEMRQYLYNNSLGLRDSLSIKDKNGMTPFHLAIEHENYDLLQAFLNFMKLDDLIIKNNDGNTAIHLIIQHGNFDFLLRMLKHAVREEIDLNLLLENENKEGITEGFLIGSRKELLSELEEYIQKDPTLVGIRSVYGITIPEMKDYVNTMGVIAALLTTISFTAAFTVPGGLNQDKGTPLLIMKPSFQAFMVFDVLTMCLSTMVLFCLLWIMAVRSKRKSVMLMDFCLTLLQLSFYTTLLTFMTGVYAANFLVKPWIAIYTLVICSLLMLLMRKYFAVELLGPHMGNLLSHFRKLLICENNRLAQLCSRLVSSPKKVFDAVIKFCKATHFPCKKILKSQKKEPPTQV